MRISAMNINPVILSFEKRTGLGPTFAARLLGIAYPTYAAYRNQSRKLPNYHRCHIRMSGFLDAAQLKKYVESHSK